MKMTFMQPLVSRLWFRHGTTVRRGIRLDRRSPIWTMAGGMVVSTILFWVMVQLGQASSEPKHQAPAAAVLTKVGPPMAAEGTGPAIEGQPVVSGMKPSGTQGPAAEVPREVIDLLEQRKHDLDRREEGVRQQERRLLMVKEEVEKLLEKQEALDKQMQTAQAQKAQQAAKQQATEQPSTQRTKAVSEKERVVQEQRTQLTKIYEAMPSEDAAARLERMPDRKAIEILRMVKPKIAGAILSQVKADRAAKLTEQLLVHEQ